MNRDKTSFSIGKSEKYRKNPSLVLRQKKIEQHRIEKYIQKKLWKIIKVKIPKLLG